MCLGCLCMGDGRQPNVSVLNFHPSALFETVSFYILLDMADELSSEPEDFLVTTFLLAIGIKMHDTLSIFTWVLGI